MYKIEKHPILDIPQSEIVEFLYEGRKVQGRKGYTIAAALHQAGFPVHSHSVDGKPRSLECGIGKCGACEMLVDGKIRRICITPVDNVHEVREISNETGGIAGRFGADRFDLYCRHTENYQAIYDRLQDTINELAPNNSKVAGPFLLGSGAVLHQALIHINRTFVSDRLSPGTWRCRPF